MEIFRVKQDIPFMKYSRLSAVISIIIFVLSASSLSIKGLNFGIDFTGGTMIELSYEEEAKLGSIRSTLEKNGYGDAIVQNFGSIHDVLIRLPILETENMAELSNKIVATLQSGHESKIDVRRVEFVGPQVGEELTEQGGLAMLYALIGILIYVSLRFEYRFAIGSVVALVHDVLLTLGFFSILQLEQCMGI